MAKTAQIDIRVLDMEEAKALVDRCKRVVEYANLLERAYFRDSHPRAIQWAREEHGITDADMEIGDTP